MKFRCDWDRERFYAGERRYFPSYVYRQNLPEDSPEMAKDAWVQSSGFRMYDRRVLIPFENRWSLSVIWGHHTYSSNYDVPRGKPWLGLASRGAARPGEAWHGEEGEGRESGPPPFIEEPSMVEVGVLAPFDNPRGNGLIGDPLAYVEVEPFNQVATVVSSFPSGERPKMDADWDSTEEFLIWARAWAMEFNEEHR